MMLNCAQTGHTMQETAAKAWKLPQTECHIFSELKYSSKWKQVALLKSAYSAWAHAKCLLMVSVYCFRRTRRSNFELVKIFYPPLLWIGIFI
jgi:hypothetical protein